jgi:hypothetical protein
MELRDRILYHQIHPLKLATDWGTAFGAAYLLWRHAPLPALLLGIIPSVVVSMVLVRWADLAPYRDSSFGRSLRHHMSPSVEGARLLGLVPFWGGAWQQRPVLMVSGVLWILGCWAWGLRPKASSDHPSMEDRG